MYAYTRRSSGKHHDAGKCGEGRTQTDIDVRCGHRWWPLAAAASSPIGHPGRADRVRNSVPRRTVRVRVRAALNRG
jgi:hypothetical protein